MNKITAKNRRKKSIRKKISGTLERPRMCISKSNRAIGVQIINDLEGKTLCSASTKLLDTDSKKTVATRKNTNFGTKLGEHIAKITLDKGIEKVVFDRSGYQYHGVLKALADAARKNGLKF